MNGLSRIGREERMEQGVMNSKKKKRDRENLAAMKASEGLSLSSLSLFFFSSIFFS